MIVESLLVKKKKLRSLKKKNERKAYTPKFSCGFASSMCKTQKCLVQRNVYLQLYRPEHGSCLYKEIVLKLESAIIHHNTWSWF